MASDPKDSKLPERLPFEPTHKKKSAKPDPKPAVEKSPKKPKREKQPRVSTPVKVEKKEPLSDRKTAKKSPRSSRDSGTIPEVVSKRMARRMALFCGIPSALGMLTFIASYLLLVKSGIKLPNVAVVLVSMGFLGLGVLGLSYGLISASWDEDRVGTRVGLEEFSLNFKRLTDAWKSARQKKELSD